MKKSSVIAAVYKYKKTKSFHCKTTTEKNKDLITTVFNQLAILSTLMVLQEASSERMEAVGEKLLYHHASKVQLTQ